MPHQSQAETPLYRHVLGSDFGRLDPLLQEFHRTVPNQGRGQLTVERSPRLIGRMLATLAGLPQTAERVLVDLHVTAIGDGERWVRSFNGRPLMTTQRPWRNLLLESGGPLTFGFRLVVEAGGMLFDQQRTWLLGVPLPMLLAPRISAVATPAAGGWHIDVRMALPLVGPMIRYHGIMVPTAHPAKAEELAGSFRQK
jgi:hypothetical protein